MTTWTPVEPLTDETQDRVFWYEPWTPKIGDRVRVRLSGECQFRFLSATVERGGAIVSEEDLPDLPGHEDGEHGRCGRIAHIVGEGLLIDCHVREGHRYVVDYDRPMYDADGPVQGKTYAAAELEPLAALEPDGVGG